MIISNDLKILISEVNTAKHLSLSALARAVHVSKGTIYRVHRGKSVSATTVTKFISFYCLFKMQEACQSFNLIPARKFLTKVNPLLAW